MKGNRTGVIKVHCKSSGKNCSGKTNICTIFFGDTVSQGTFKLHTHIYTIHRDTHTTINDKILYIETSKRTVVEVLDSDISHIRELRTQEYKSIGSF